MADTDWLVEYANTRRTQNRPSRPSPDPRLRRGHRARGELEHGVAKYFQLETNGERVFQPAVCRIEGIAQGTDTRANPFLF